MWRKGNPSTLLVGMQIGEATVEKSMEFPHTKNGTKTKNGKLKMELLFVPAIPLLGLYPKNPETPIQKNLCTPMSIAAQFIIAKYWKQPECPSVNECLKKLWYIYMMEYYRAEKKKELLPFMTAWVELESIMLSEISQEVKDKYRMISPISKI